MIDPTPSTPGAATWSYEAMSNVGVVVLDTILVRLVFPTTAIGFALVAGAQGWGLFQAIDLPTWPKVLRCNRQGARTAWKSTCCS